MISLSNVTKQFGESILFENASFQINPGQKMGLVGPNGAGKSSLFRLIMGEESADQGQVSKPERLVISYFSQDVGEMSGRSVLNEVLSAAEKITRLQIRMKEIEQILEKSAEEPIDDDLMASLLEEYGEGQSFFETRGGYELEPAAKRILTGLGFKPSDLNEPIESFSGGWKMRAALAKVLLVNPDVLLMDEPTNHLDLESILWLEHWLIDFKGAVLMTSHDRDFMNRIVSKIVSIEQRKVIVYGGNYDFYEKERQIRLDQLLSAHKRQEDMLAKEHEFISRFAARASHAAQVQSRVKKLEKIERIEIPAEQQRVKFIFPKAPRSGNDVVKMENIGKTWTKENGQQNRVFHGITGMVRRLDKIAIVGVNGAGKSTFLKVISNQTDATEGKSTMGASLTMGYFSQHALEVLNPSATVLEEIQTRNPDLTLGSARSLLGAFLFPGDSVHKKVSVLSGGEKSRLVLAGILSRPVNFLVLDEPTNHLDIVSREILMEALQEFEGTIVIVSHDRHFLRQIANRVFEIHDGELRTYEGRYDEYLERVESQISQLS